ncbi:MAG: hypothetical protein R2747_09915 [Pyrinomonadaceae bacterium]
MINKSPPSAFDAVIAPSWSLTARSAIESPRPVSRSRAGATR